MSRPWMPFYVADYLADTGHLSTVEHGAYLLLILHYWQNGGLPSDEARLARIARLNAREWARSRDALAALFRDGWRHKRIDQELARADDITSKRRAAAEQRHGKRDANAHANGHAIADQLDTHAGARASVPQPQSQSHTPSSLRSDALFDDPATDYYRRGKVVCGDRSGGLLKRNLEAHGGNVAKARAAIETASTKASPREYLGAVVAARDRARIDADDHSF